MLFTPTFDPFHNLGLSATIAAIPIVLFLLGLTVFKMKGLHAALMTLVVTLVLSFYPFHLPANIAAGSIAQGVVLGIWPIGYIVIMAVWLYRLTVSSGQFDVIKHSLAMISPDQRIQLLLIAFCFGAFLEGAAGFGVPIAIGGVMLAALGFHPLEAAMLCLIANGAAGPFGAIGIPVAIIDTFNLPGVSTMAVSKAINTTFPWLTMTIPFVMIWILDGFRGIRETLPALLAVSISYTLTEFLVTEELGPLLADILPALVSLVVLALLSMKWQPKRIFRVSEEEDENAGQVERLPAREVFAAWLPFILLSVCIIVWSLPGFKHLFAAGQPLNFSELSWNIASLDNHHISIHLSLLKATGTSILLAAILTIIISHKTLSLGRALADLWGTIKSFWQAVLTICCILAIAKLSAYTGMTKALGEGISNTGQFFPLLSPILGWIGVFMTGSVVNNNTLFAPVQSVVAHNLHINPSLLVSVNTTGGAIGKMVSTQSIAIATAGVGHPGEEAKLLKMVLKYSVGYLVFICLWTFILVTLITH